jgi:hypothetical protein
MQLIATKSYKEWKRLIVNNVLFAEIIDEQTNK